MSTANKTEFKLMLIGFFIFTCTYGWTDAAEFMFQGYGTISFIGLYLLARYIRVYSPKWSKMSVLTDIMIYGLITLIVGVTSFILVSKEVNVPLDLYSYISPTTILGALFLLLAFTKIELQNKFINWCGISCFAVFLMHVSPSTLWYYKDFFILLHNNTTVATFWITTFLVLIIIFIVSICVDKIRIRIWNFFWVNFLCAVEHRVVNYLNDKITD